MRKLPAQTLLSPVVTIVGSFLAIGLIIASQFLSFNGTDAPGGPVVLGTLDSQGNPPAVASDEAAVFQLQPSLLGLDPIQSLTKLNPESNIGFEVTVTDPTGQEVKDIKTAITKSVGQPGGSQAWDITIEQGAMFKPGRYTLTARATDGADPRTISQDFLWGVLAINTHKSIYGPGETVAFDMAVLNESGEMVCDADVTLEIEGPSSTALSTGSGQIRTNDDCRLKTVVSAPDYEASWRVPELTLGRHNGVYNLTLTAVTATGEYSVTDSFRVGPPENALTERRGNTRIFPVNSYTMSFDVTPAEDFNGIVSDTVPASFTLLSSFGADLIEDGNSTAIDRSVEITKDAASKTKRIGWQVQLKRGQTYRFSYAYDAPDMSPEFYLLGPISLKSDSLEFSEPRRWQIASDALDYLDPNADGSAGSWSATGSATRFGAIDEAVRQPSTPGTSDYISAAANGNSAAFLRLSSLTNVTSVSQVQVWFYHNDNGNCQDNVALYDDNETTQRAASQALTVRAANTWDSLTFSGLSLTQAQLDTLSVRLTTSKPGGGPSTDCQIYAMYAEATYTPAAEIITVGTAGNHATGSFIPATDLYVGGAFTMIRNSNSTNVTSIKVRNTGTVNAQANLSNLTLYYKPEASCSSTLPGDATLFNASPGSFDASGDSTVTGTMSVGTSQVCVYAEVDVGSGTADGDTLKFQITNPSSDVVASAGTVEPATAVAIAGSITLATEKPENATFYNSDDGSNFVAFNSVRQNSVTPIFRVSATYSSTFDTFQLELNTASDFSGTSYTEAVSSTYTSATEYNIQTTSSLSLPATDGVTYYARIRASSTSGSTYGGWSSEAWSYTYKSATTNQEWFQTTDAQFSDDTLTGVITSGFDSVAINAGVMTQSFTASGTSTWDVPAGVTQITAKVWGAGGGGGAGDGSSFVGGNGGGGGYAQADISVTPEETLTIDVGSGGPKAAQNHSGGSGGGYSVLRQGATFLIQAGAAGGGGGSNGSAGGGYGGGGGGSTGQTGESKSTGGGGGGTQLAGGAGGAGGTGGTAGVSGIANAGGDGGGSNVNCFTPVTGTGGAGGTGGGGLGGGGSSFFCSGGAGGGGGYYGGGGSGSASWSSSRSAGGGGGGSNYLTGSNQTNSQASGITPPNTGDSDYSAGAGVGGTGAISAAAATAGGGGQVVISYSIPQGTILSTPISYDLAAKSDSWDTFDWTEDETNGSISVQLYFTDSTTCDTVVPNTALAGNESGFASGPVDISGLDTGIYDELCLLATLDVSGDTPYLQDWTVTWVPTPILYVTTYRFYENTNAIQPITPLANENTTITTPWKGTVLRLRTAIQSQRNSYPASSIQLKLQYGPGSTCSGVGSWIDVDSSSGSGIWRYHDNSSVADGATISASLLDSQTNVLESYAESSPTPLNSNIIAEDARGEWDWSIENNGADPDLDYCFRIVDSAGNTLEYSAYPQIIGPGATLSVDIVDSNGDPVASPSTVFSSMENSINCQTSTATLGVAGQRVRIGNNTLTPGWTLSIFATPTDLWSAGTPKYDFNDPTGSPLGCGAGLDSDAYAGLMTIDASTATASPSTSCSNTGLGFSSSTYFEEGVSDTLSLVSASSGADELCYWDVTGISVQQQVPAAQPVGSYTINLMLTITAS